MSVVQISADEYHADTLGERPSLSSSIAHLLCTRSPRHAWTAHPRLNPNWTRLEEEKFDVGNVAHAMILEGVDVVERGEYPDWRTKEAKAWRDDVRARGKIPLLVEQYARVGEMVAAVYVQLSQHRADPPLFAQGIGEPVVVWDVPSHGIACRARLDWLREDLATIDDLKTTSRSAEPGAYARNLYSVGGDIQAAFYTWGVQTAHDLDVQPRFRWVVVETEPPYALSVIEPGPDVLALGDAKVRYAVTRWAELLEFDQFHDGKREWPGYPLDVVRAELPPWEETRWLERMGSVS